MSSGGLGVSDRGRGEQAERRRGNSVGRGYEGWTWEGPGKCKLDAEKVKFGAYFCHSSFSLYFKLNEHRLWGPKSRPNFSYSDAFWRILHVGILKTSRTLYFQCTLYSYKIDVV